MKKLYGLKNRLPEVRKSTLRMLAFRQEMDLIKVRKELTKVKQEFKELENSKAVKLIEKIETQFSKLTEIVWEEYDNLEVLK